MRRSSALPKPPTDQPLPQTHAWLTIRTLFPYLWRYRLRVLAALKKMNEDNDANARTPQGTNRMSDGKNVAEE